MSECRSEIPRTWIRMAAMYPEQKHRTHHLGVFTYSGLLKPSAFEALERLKARKVWGGFLDLHKSVNVR